MGHAAHFLRRLDRVSDGQVELALTLYRDDGLLREVLGRAALPDGAERVAISLADPVEGPFVVVTREGRFVTCLGAGMRPGDLPIVTRERLDVAASSVQRMRDRLEKARALAASGADGQAALAFTRMQQQGPRFCREDAETLLRAMPLIEPLCCTLLRDRLLDDDHLDRLRRYRLDDPRRMSPAQQDYVLAVGDLAWSVAHLVVLVSPASIRRTFPGIDARATMHSCALLASSWGTMVHFSRALWFQARGGKDALAEAKRFDPGSRLHAVLWRELAVGAVGVRSEKLRAEALKALGSRGPLDFDLERDESVVSAYTTMFSKLIAAAAHDPDKVDRTYLEVSRSWVRTLSGNLGVPLDEGEEVAEDVARAAGVLVAISLHEPLSVNVQMRLPMALPWLARAAPEALFLPGEWARRLLPHRGLEDVLYWLRPRARSLGLMRRRRPVTRKSPKAGRNDPCPCGSGKKHKRCCG